MPPSRGRPRDGGFVARARGVVVPPLRGLLLAIDLATRNRDAASAVVQQWQHVCFGAQNQMGQLESYAMETESNWALGSRSSAQPEIMRHYDQFMERLQQAVDMQRGVVEEHLRATASARQSLLEAEIRIAGLKRLLDTRRASAARVQGRQEQKQLDDLSALQFRRLHASPDNLEIR